MTKPTLVAATLAVWTAAFGATGAFVRWVQPPHPITPQATSLVTTPPAAEVVEVTPLPAAAIPTIVMPTFEIVSRVPRAVTPPAPKPPRDISEMKCSPWRPLEQGSNSVQICE